LRAARPAISCANSTTCGKALARAVGRN
jgi:hypothetical protein